MSRQQRRKMERDERSRQRRIQSLQSYINEMRLQGVLPMPKPTLFQRIKRLFKKWQ